MCFVPLRGESPFPFEFYVTVAWPNRCSPLQPTAPFQHVPTQRQNTKPVCCFWVGTCQKGQDANLWKTCSAIGASCPSSHTTSAFKQGEWMWSDPEADPGSTPQWAMNRTRVSISALTCLAELLRRMSRGTWVTLNSMGGGMRINITHLNAQGCWEDRVGRRLPLLIAHWRKCEMQMWDAQWRALLSNVLQHWIAMSNAEGHWLIQDYLVSILVEHEFQVRNCPCPSKHAVSLSSESVSVEFTRKEQFLDVIPNYF